MTTGDTQIAIGSRHRPYDDREFDKLSKTIASTIAIIQNAVPHLTTARDLIDRFPNFIRSRDKTDLAAWLADGKSSLVASFAKGIVQDQAAEDDGAY